MSTVFDPLDFLGEKVSLNSQISDECMIDDHKVKEPEPEPEPELTELITESDRDAPVQPLDLPYVRYASPLVTLTILKLLQPAVQVNFKSSQKENGQTWESICLNKGISISMLNATKEYYETFPNALLDSRDNICRKISDLLDNKTCDSELLSYFTGIISKYEHSSDDLADLILQQASLRISERCGRTAQPSMTRIFNIESLPVPIKLHEPALTSDNLGLKTWGSSLILSQKIVGIPAGQRVLELGSGTGLVGISYAVSHLRNSDAAIYLTDLPEIVPNLRHNVLLNDLDTVITDVLDWTDPTPFITKHGDQKFDVILIADPIYSTNHPAWVVNMISMFLSPNGVVHLEIPVRPKYESERAMLWRLLSKNDLIIRNEQQDKGRDDWGDVEYLYKEITRN